MISLKIVLIKYHSNLPGANELIVIARVVVQAHDLVLRPGWSKGGLLNFTPNIFFLRLLQEDQW